MWVTTKTGFVSAVQDRTDPSIFKVRARDKQSLESMLMILETEGHDIYGLDIITGAGTDYRWRVLLPRELFGAFLTASSDNVDYPNFKSAITKTRGKVFHDALMKVWDAMLAVDDGEVDPKRPWDLAGRTKK